MIDHSAGSMTIYRLAPRCNVHGKDDGCLTMPCTQHTNILSCDWSAQCKSHICSRGCSIPNQTQPLGHFIKINIKSPVHSFKRCNTLHDQQLQPDLLWTHMVNFAQIQAFAQ